MTPLGTTTAAAACTEAVRAAILSGEFEAGSRLPPERDLAAQLGVNRVTLRAALTRLQSEGLITTRQGSGHLVHDFRRRGGPQLLATLARPKVHFADLLAVRRALASLVLQRLFDDPPSPTALDALEREVARFEKSPSAQTDLDVTAKLLSLTGSVTLQLCINPVASVLLALPSLQDAMFKEPATNAAGYRTLIEALRHARRETKAGRARLASEAIALLEQIDAATLSRT